LQEADTNHPSPSPSQTGPIFIGGAGRSGTTLIRAMLDSHPRICCGPELKLLAMVGDFYNGVVTQLPPFLTAYGVTPLKLRRSFRQFVESIVDDYCRAAGKQRWAEKTPNNVLHFIPLAEIFPDARFIHMVRDGRDVACSLMKMVWTDMRTGQRCDYTQDIGRAAQYWRFFILAARQSLAHPALAGRVLTLQYEQLATEPEPAMRKVLEFLAEPWDPAVLTYYLKDRSHEPVDSNTKQISEPTYTRSIGRWRTEMSQPDRIAFEREAGDLLREFGYTHGDWIHQ
jgi:hypothetical protein